MRSCSCPLRRWSLSCSTSGWLSPAVAAAAATVVFLMDSGEAGATRELLCAVS